MTTMLSLALLALAAPATPLGGQDPAVSKWILAWRNGAPLEERAVQGCAERLDHALSGTAPASVERAGLWGQVFDLLAFTRPAEADSSFLGERPFADGGQLALQRWLQERMYSLLAADSAVRSWVIEELLPQLAGQTPARRAAGLDWLLARPTGELVTPLLVVARRDTDPLRGPASLALAGWAAHSGPLESIDSFLVAALAKEQAWSVPHPFGLLQLRLESCPIPLLGRARSQLEERVRGMLLSQDWRQACRALQLSGAFESRERVPVLLDALAAWNRRAATGRGSRRVEADIAAELERVSGRRLGTNAGNWITWWIAVRQGRVELVTPAEQGRASATNPEPQTRSEFFGLRPESDRVTFVIDHSGSMAQAWGTQSTSRYEEAIAQMTRYLQAIGKHGRFNVILFDSETLLSSEELISSSPENIERARKATLDRPPSGGTVLRPAIELALLLDERGLPSASLQADTIVVLCDGDNSDGHGWIAPLLDRVQTLTQIRFHCVQIGHQGGAALQKLADRTGGQFVRVGG